MFMAGVILFVFVPPASVSLLANLPEDKLSKIVDCLEVVSHSVKTRLHFHWRRDKLDPFHCVSSGGRGGCTTALAAPGSPNFADSCCQNIITVRPYSITARQRILSASSQQDPTNYLVDEQSWYYSRHRRALYIVTRIIWPRPQKVFIRKGGARDVRVGTYNFTCVKALWGYSKFKNRRELVSFRSNNSRPQHLFTIGPSRTFPAHTARPATFLHGRISLFGRFLTELIPFRLSQRGQGKGEGCV